MFTIYRLDNNKGNMPTNTPNRAENGVQKETAGVLDIGKTFKELIPPFTDYLIYDLGFNKNTAKKYSESLNWVMHDLPYLKYVQELKLADITELKKKIILRGAGECRVNSILFPLRKFLSYCNQVHGIATINPREVRAMKIPQRTVDYLTKEEFSQFIKVMDTGTMVGLRMRTLVEVLVATGGRISEILSINHTDIDWEGREVTIIGKGNRQRTLFLNERAIGWIQTYLLRRKDNEPFLFSTFGQPKRLSSYDMSKQFKRFSDKAGLKKQVHPHMLRHTTGTWMQQDGADTRDIQLVLGHSDIRTTAKYYLGVDKKKLKESHSKHLRYE